MQLREIITGVPAIAELEITDHSFENRAQAGGWKFPPLLRIFNSVRTFRNSSARYFNVQNIMNDASG